MECVTVESSRAGTERQREQLESITEGRVIPFQLLLSVNILLVLLLLSLFLLTAFRLCTSDVIFFSIFTFFFLLLLLLFTAVLILVSLFRQKLAVITILAKILFVLYSRYYIEEELLQIPCWI